MDNLSAALKGLFDKISDFFNIFDLSFFISGFLCFGALCFQFKDPKFFNDLGFKDGSLLFAVIASSYVLGLICFTGGRLIRKVWLEPGVGKGFDKTFPALVQAHGLDQVVLFQTYVKSKDWMPLYTYMWNKLREVYRAKRTYTLVMRYWVLAATYDGIAMAILIWIGVLLLQPPLTAGCCVFCLMHSGQWLSLGLFLPTLLCLREAGRYDLYQQQELVAIMALIINENIKVNDPCPTN